MTQTFTHKITSTNAGSQNLFIDSVQDKPQYKHVTYWLIEYMQAKPCPVYIQEIGSFYTCNPWDARRFDTKHEAEAFMNNPNRIPMLFPWMAIEHGFSYIVDRETPEPRPHGHTTRSHKFGNFCGTFTDPSNTFRIEDV